MKKLDRLIRERIAFGHHPSPNRHWCSAKESPAFHYPMHHGLAAHLSSRK